jgi:hypothetical protein
MEDIKMKKIILIMLICMAFYSNIKADCTISSTCKSEEFPYFLCNSGSRITVCTDDPYSIAGYTPIKNAPCFTYDASSYHIEYKETSHVDVISHNDPYALEDDYGNYYYGEYDGTTIYKPGTNTPITGYYDEAGYHYYEYGDYIDVPYDTHDTYTTRDPCNEVIVDAFGNTVFDYSAVQSCVNNAISEWQNQCSGCSLNNDYNSGCCVTIKWTTDWKKISSNPSEVKDIYAVTHVIPNSDCKWDCSQLVIYLNQTDDYTGAKSSDRSYQNFFFTGSNTGNSTGDNFACLLSTIEHEMGHVLGFGDEYAGSGAGTACATDGSVMNNTHVYDNVGLSEDDKCMYKKLYCPGTTSVKETNKEIITEINIFPNPVSDYLSIDIKNLNIINYIINTKIDIYNIYGQKILECPYSDKIDVSKLLPGAYYFRIADKIEKFIKL